MLPLESLQNTNIPSDTRQNKKIHVLETLVGLFSIEQNFVIPVLWLVWSNLGPGPHYKFWRFFTFTGVLFFILFCFGPEVVSELSITSSILFSFWFIIMQKIGYKHWVGLRKENVLCLNGVEVIFRCFTCLLQFIFCYCLCVQEIHKPLICSGFVVIIVRAWVFFLEFELNSRHSIFFKIDYLFFCTRRWVNPPKQVWE